MHRGITLLGALSLVACSNGSTAPVDSLDAGVGSLDAVQGSSDAAFEDGNLVTDAGAPPADGDADDTEAGSTCSDAEHWSGSDCTPRSDCDDLCSGHGSCTSGRCDCDPGYEGPNCASCAAGYHRNESDDACTAAMCDPPCATNEQCDEETGQCCVATCAVGTVECRDGRELICTACRGWQLLAKCESDCASPASCPPDDKRTVQWGDSAFDYMEDAAITTEGMVALSGYTDRNGGVSQGLLIGQPSAGTSWEYVWDDSGANRADGVAVAPDGRLVVVRTVEAPNDGGRNLVLSWHSTTGALDDERPLDAAGESARDLAVGPEGDLWIMGRGYGAGIFVRRTSPSGDERWVTEWGTGSASPTTIVVDDAGTAFVCGGCPDPVAADAMGSGQLFCSKLDASGSLAWTREWGPGIGGVVTDALLLPDGNLLAGGRTTTVPVGDEAFLAQLDPAGNEPEVTIVDGGTSITGLTLPGDGYLYITGYVSRDVFVQRREVGGTVVWDDVFGSEGRETRAKPFVTDDGSIHVAGITRGAFPGFTNDNESYDVFLVTIPPSAQ